MGDEGFKFLSVNPEEEPYLHLETSIIEAWNFGAPKNYVAFWEVESNFYCFDTSVSRENGEFPIVFWEHDAPNDNKHHQFPDFIHWLANRLARNDRERPF